jgi:hypothetical protein
MLEQFHPFAAGRRIACVVQIDEHEIELTRSDRADHGSRRRRRFDVEALRLQKKSEGLHDVGLVVGDENA